MKIETREEHKAALMIVEKLMDYDPDKGTPAGECLSFLAKQASDYEIQHMQPWYPSHGQEVWILSGSGLISQAVWKEQEKMKKRMSMGFLFNSKREAETAKSIIRETMYKLHKSV